MKQDGAGDTARTSPTRRSMSSEPRAGLEHSGTTRVQTSIPVFIDGGHR